ncbi:hypothetical protein UPYG_G00008250 [Umbra pygmaea]|uniref:Sushi domain-containing protein n=1 Tax=Umbra pygmaea TaxID=75934 RepID=A0ABD0XHZ3_UMBPY
MHLEYNIVFFLSIVIHASAQTPSGCGEPPTFPFMKVDNRYKEKIKFNDGDKVIYKCAEGYKGYQGTRSILCKAGQWTVLSLKCEKKSCGSAGDLFNGYFNYTGSSIGDKAYAVCNKGFTRKGVEYKTCNDSGWTEGFPTCEDITCPRPKAQENNPIKSTVINGLKEVYRPQDSLSFSCTGLYNLTGSSNVTCGVDGKWTPSFPKCTIIKCPLLNIINGRTSTGQRKRGTKVIISCLNGNELQGPGVIECSSSGRWKEGIPQCVPASQSGRMGRAEITCPYPAVANSVKPSDAVEVYRVRDSVSVVCSDGFLLSGEQQITCGPDGQWLPQLPQCLPFSSKLDGACVKPPNYPNQHVSVSSLTKTHFGPGDRVKYSCNIGYAKVRGSYYSNCINGKWTPLNLRCDRKSCGSAGEINFGYFLYTGVEFGHTATGVCNEGYHLVGQNVRNCMNDGWDGRVPVCEPVQCPEPPTVSYGAIAEYSDPPYQYSTVISYWCRKGILIGAKEIYCTKDGTWSNPPPQCRNSKFIVPH